MKICRGMDVLVFGLVHIWYCASSAREVRESARISTEKTWRDETTVKKLVLFDAWLQMQ